MIPLLAARLADLPARLCARRCTYCRQPLGWWRCRRGYLLCRPCIRTAIELRTRYGGPACTGGMLRALALGHTGPQFWADATAAAQAIAHDLAMNTQGDTHAETI